MIEPRHHTARSGLPTRGAGVAAIAKAKRAPLMPWQRQGVDVALEYDEASGLYRYGIIVVSVPRQSGKTKLEGDVADHRCLTVPRGRVWITMQNGKTVDSWMRSEHFSNLAAAKAFGVPSTKSAKYQLTKRAGEVGVLWPALGSSFLTFPPKRDALHSKQADLAFIDEAWAHNAEVGADIRQAVRPTMATRPGAQLWIVSTMGDDSSTFLDDYISMGRESLGNPNTRVCFIDYGIPDDADPEDLDTVAAHHPAYGHTIGMQTLIDAREEFAGDVAGFARAYGNRATRTKEVAISAAAWSAAARPRPDIPKRTGLALDVTPAGTRAAIGAAWRDEKGEAHLEVLYSNAPTRELPQLLVQLSRRNRAPITVDRGSIGALEVIDAVHRLSPSTEVRFLSMAEYAQACGTLYRGVLDDTAHHHNDADLTAAVENAAKRDLGDGAFGWGRKDSAGSIAELVAVTVALKGFDMLPKPRLSAGIILPTPA